jgi:hypothetical protein
METRNNDSGIDRRVMDNIRFNARRLARSGTIPGMEVQDYEQDLVADLLHRRRAFDPTLASFVTFADRIIGHRSNTLRRPSFHLWQERSVVSLDAPAGSGDEQTIADLLPDEAPQIDKSTAIRIDVGRFVEGLPPLLLDCCEILLADSISAGARAAGIHRSTAYERARRLRERALAHGLAIYLSGSPDSFARPPVDNKDQVGPTLACDSDQAGHSIMNENRQPSIVRLPVSEVDLCAWLDQAAPGDILEYHRGFLAIDVTAEGTRLPERERAELSRVARRAMFAAEHGLAHLAQRRLKSHHFSYFAIARECAGSVSNFLSDRSGP